MAIDRNKLKQIYSTLQSGGYRQDYQTFEKGFTNKDNYATRKKTYDLLTAHGAQIGGSYEEFMKKLQVSGSHSSMRTGKSGVAGGHPLSEAEKQQMMGNATRLAENAKAIVSDARNRIANQMAIVKKPFNTSVRIGENKNVREKGYSYNPNSGKLEKTYVTTLGNEYNSRYDADQEQRQIDQLNHDSSLGGQLENAYAERDRLDKAMKKRKQEIDKGGNKLTDFLRELAGANSGGPMASRDASRAKYDSDSEYQQLMAAARKNHTTIQLLEDKKNNKMNEFWHNVGTTMLNGYTFSDGLSEMQDAIALQEAEKHLDSINKKRAKGKKLTRDEQAAEAVLKNFATNDAMLGLYGDDYGAWGRAGKTLAQGLDFMYDIGISGDLGGMVTKGVSKAVVKGATKGLTKIAGKEAEKLLAKKAMQYTLKATGIGVGAHLGGLAIANTTALGKTVGQLGSAVGGHVVTDDKGSYHVVDKQKLLPALAEVERSQAREYGSEMIGEFLPGGKILKKGLTKVLEKIGLSKVASTFTNIGTKQWYKQYSNLLKAGGYNGIPGEVLEEYEGSLFDALTGHADDAWRDMTSLRTHVDIALGCASMGVVLGAVPMMGAVNHTANYYGYKHKTDKADKVASSLVGDEKWGAIRDKIDQTENGKMTDVLVGILTDKELNDNAKNATLDYVRNLTKMRGYNIANVNCAAEESMEATPTDQHEGEAAQQQDRQNGAKIITERMNASYGMGYNATDAPSMYDAGVTLKAQENRLSKLLGVGDVRNAMGEDPMAFVEKRKQAGASAEEVQAMEDFLVADSAVKGIRQRMADNLDSRLSESDAEMEKRINTEDGMVHKAVMQVRNQDDKEHEVYVLKGNVRMNADGRGVDASSSDNEIYVYDSQEGKTRMMPPSFIERIDEPVDAETVRRAAGESIRQDYQSELAKLDTSGLSFQVGDRYDAVDERGVQHRIEVVGGAVDDAGNAMSGYVGVRVDGGEAVSMRTDEIAKMVGNADVQRREAELSGEASEDGHASDADHAVDADDIPTYAQNEVLTLLDEHGNPVRAEITAAANEDGLYEVLTDEPIDGKRVSMMSAEEIAAKAPLNPPGRVENEPTKDLQGQEDDTTLEAGESGDVNSALSRIPMDEETQEPRYEEVDADTAWDAIVEQTNGDRALAQEVVDDTVNEMSSGIEKAEKAISKATFKGKGIQERIAFAKDKQERMAALDLEKERLAKWKRIASVERMRAAAVEAEKSRAASAERKARQEEEEKARLAREEAERQKREALNGVPDFVEDKASDARARGYRRVNGDKVDRQEPLAAVQGKDVQVKFDDKNIPSGHVALIDADELQPSHKNGQRNPLHFIDEAQPKERKDDASKEAARKIASNIRPEEITSSVTAYTGAPTVNSRGEVIQGNNRSAALKEMWAAYKDQGEKYKQYLIDHAAELGLNPDEVRAMEKPILVNMLDVDDDDAIALGQFVASDTESGGVERIKPKNVVKKLGDKMKNFASLLLRSTDEDMSFSELIDRNGVDVLKWMNANGSITPTQYKSAFDSKGNLTAEAKNDLKGVMYQSIFEGGSTQLEEMFNALPAKAQKAILATAYRDYDSPHSERMIEELQNSIMAYYALSHDAQFMAATNHKDARMAVEAWKRQYAIDDNTGESYLPAEKYSNFVLLLATMYKGDNQSFIQGVFNKMYDLIQGTQEETLFEQPDNTPRSLVEAIKETLNIDYNGQQRNDVLVGGTTTSQRGEQGSNGDSATGGRSESSDGTETHQGGTEAEIRAEKPVETEPKPIGKGVFGNIYDQFKGKAKEAVAFLRNLKSGEAIGALHHKDVGEIAIVWGNAKAGLQKIAKKHPEVLDNLQEVIDGMNVVQESDNRIKLESDTHFAVVSRDWQGEKRSPWLLTAYEKKENSATNNRMNTADTSKGKRNDTATPQDTASASKDKQSSDTKQANEQKSAENNAVSEDLERLNDGVRTERQRNADELRNDTEKDSSEQASGDKSFKITPQEYTTKRGKKLAMQLVTFESELSKEQMNAAKQLAKEAKGWWSKKDGGFLMRDMESAQKLADVVLDDADAVADAQPLSLEDMSAVNDQETVQAIDNAIHVKPKEQTTLRYDYDREDEVRDQVLTGLRKTLDNGSGIPNIKAIESQIRDLRKRIKTIDNGLATAGEATAARGYEALAMLTGRLKAYEKFLSDIRKKMQEAERDEALAAHGVKLGDKILYKGKEATIHDADAKQVILDTGLGPVLYEVIDCENVELPKSVKENHKGEELSTEQKPTSEQPTMQQAKEETQQEEKEAKSKWVDDADAARFEELRQRLHEKLNGQLNMGIDPEAFSIGVEMSYLMLKHGARKFGDFARQMVEALGENVRPYLKSFYNGARDLPEMADYENEMTPYDEVRSFDVMNFDKEGSKDIFATAEHVAREQAVEREAREATKKLKEQRNEQRKEIEQQVAADTEATRSEATTVASEAESKLPSARNEREVNDIAKEIDDAIDKVNDQLAVLGYYKAEPVESDYNEAYGYMRNAERKAVKNVTGLYKTLVKELGIQDPVVLDAKGKKQKSVTANIAPAGGDVTMRFMLNRKKGVTLYMNFTLEPDGDNLKLGNIMFRPEKGRDYLRANNYFPADVTLSQMLHGIRSVCEEWLPKEDYVAIAQHVSSKEENEPKKNQPKEIQSNRKSLSSQEKNIPDLFSGLFGDDELKPTSNEQEVHVQARPGTSEREGGHQREQNESLGASQQHEDERADAERVVGRSGKNTMSDTSGGSRLSELSDGKLDVKPSKSEFAPLADSELKNTHNNHAARGIDYAPKSTNARIEANIKAIETMQRLVESGEPATPEDMSVLRKFSGWGGLGEAFSEMIGGPYGSINPINKRLRELLSPEAYEAANMSRNSAYYTPAPVIDAMWDVARAMGFRGGNVLEGSAGIGNIIGLMPTDMSERSDIHAVEIDETTGNILSLLYPDANVEMKGFEKTFVPNGSVDLAITNVPFVTGLRVMDETGDKDLSRKFHDIHDFCIAKNVRKLKEGGIGIFISSSGTLDSPNSAKLRTWLVNDGGADVVGAFRMHNQTFGGTGATSDIIVIRKRVNGKKSINAIDVSGTLPIRTVKYNTGETKRGSNEVIVKDLALDVNKHFVEHPEDMAGEMAFAFEKGDTYRATSKGLYPSRSINQDQRLSEWAQQFKDMDWDKAEEPKTQQVVYEDLVADIKEGSMLLDGDGNLCLAQRGKAVPLDVNTNKVKGRTKAACFNDYKAIKDALADVLAYQTTHSDDVGLKQKLDVLNKVYDAFVKTYGHLNKNTSIAFLRNDMDYPSIAALESVSETGDKSGKRVVTYGKTDIFSRRVVETESEPKPTTIKDGIIASLYLNGRVDVPYIAKQLGKNESEVREQIIKSGLGFENPTTTEMEVSYEYLSGNVREKLRQAQENNTDGRYDANIKALERVIPMNIPAHLIEFTLGSSWVDPKLYEDFVKERTGIEVKLTNAGGTWIMSEPYWTNTEQNKAMGVISEKCDKTILGHELIKAAITCKSISVTKSVTTGYGSNRTTETIVDKEATVACANKIDEIRQDFKDWAHGKMQGDAELSERMERVYNELFNNSVPKEIPDEFVPAHFGGAATIVAGHPFQLRPHQAKAVVRATTQPLMLAHEVGTGKTYTLISTAMEMRRLGTARKPMIVVQNATVGQFVASAKALYPNAKILTLEDADRNADGRRNFYAKIRYNDWDMIVVPQSVFERIPDSEERQMRFIEDKVEEKMMVLEKMREAADNDRDPVLRQAERELDQLNDELNNLKLALQERKSGGKSKKDEKREAKSKQNAAVKAQEMLDRETDDVANFDDMGVDALLIDEAHEYKHLGFATAMQRGVKGVDPSYSKKSQGVYLKTQSVLENKNGKNVVFATGTPISNTAAEIWTFMRYLMPADTMREYGIYYFDDFVRNFGNIQQMLEFSTNGKYKENNRFAGYVNLPELVRIWSGIADTVLTREAGGVSDKIPQMDGGQAQDIYLPQTKALRGVMKYVKDQLNEYEKMSGKEKKENSHIPLVMYGIAKAAAVDARLVLEDAVDEPNSKTNEAVRQTLRSLEDTKDYNGTVAIFADNYQNKSTGFNLYEDIRKKLIESGVPKDEIVVMKSGMKVKKKLEIFDKVNRGEVRVIMGSTFTLGTGVNIQERLHTLIHVDAPNRPMDYTQRNGRILRQGNLHNEWGLPVRVLRFGVEDSLDVTAYQRLKTKGAIADSIMEGKKMMNNSMENRVLEEDQDLFGDITAQLSGSQYALLKNQVEKEVRKLEARKKQWEADQTYVHNQKPRLEGLIKDSKERAERNREALAKVEGAKQEGIVIGKQKFPTLDAMSDYIKDYNSKQREQQEQVRKASGYNAEAKSSLTVNIGGFDFHVNRVIAKEQKQEKGQLSLSFFSKTQMTYSCPELGLEDVPVDGQRLKSALEDIVNNVMSGNDFRERIEHAERAVERYKGELQQVEARDGKPFEYADELSQAKDKLSEYEELMKAEMAEKEAKYAEMDSEVGAAKNVQLTEEEDTEDDLYREGDDYDGDEDISLSHDPMSKLLGASVYTGAQRKAFGERERKRMAVHVSELSEKLNLKNVDVVTDTSTLIGDRRRAKGFFNKKTGRITIVIPNHTDMADVEKTLLHEAVAHHGLRKLFGENFDNFLDNVYRNAEYDIRERISEMSSNHGWDVRTATEEYLAGLAEDTNFENMPDGFWSKIKRFFLQMLHSIGLKNLTDVSMGDNELRYVLWRSYENLKEPGRYRNFFAEAADVAKQHQLKVGAYEVSDRADKANVADRANEADKADRADKDDELYRSGVERTVERVPDIVVSQLYEDAVKDTRDRTLLGALVRTWSKDGRTRFKNKFAESWFDYTRSVKALQDAIAKATGRKVEWFEDVWKSLNAKSSIDEREQEVMSRTLAIPLSRHISSMVRQSGGKYDLDAIEAYLNAKHGLERNELMARRAAEKAAEEAYGAEIAKCRKALAADALDTTAEERLEELTSQYDAMVKEAYAANRRDYAGLTALFDPEQEGKSLEELEDAAREYISEIEDYYDTEAIGGLWDKVRVLNNFSLKKSYESGLLSKKQYDDVSKMYKWYVPLRGWHDNYAGDVYNYVNRGADRGMIENAVKKAYGRTSRAGNILGTMSAMANSAIVVGNKNKVAQVFMNLALNHEDTGMFTISEAWYEKNEADDSWRIVTPDNRIHEDMSAEEVADTIAEWEDEMQEKAANGKALMRSGKFAKDFQHNLEAWKEQQHCVRVSRGGKEYLVYVNGNPRATQAINGLLNPDYQPGVVGRILQKYMRHLARVQTSWSPKFVISNVQRDVLTATGSAYAKNGAGYALQFEKNFAMNTKDIFGLFYKDLHGSLDMNNAKERMFKEFLDNGGKTGISTIYKKQEYEEKYNKSIYRAMHPASSAVMQGAEGIVHSVEFMNNCIENLTRFSTYMTSRQMGKSIKDAIFDAKECSVNFNMKGSGAWGNAALRMNFLYTNPALQALRMLNSWYDANSVRTVGMLASGVAMGFMVAMVNALCNGGDGEDNAYYGLSDYNRYTYFNIGIGNRKFLHWRLPQEMASLYALGHISYDRMTGRISTDRAIQLSLEQLNNYSPLSFVEGNTSYDQSADNTYVKTFVKAITPSYLSPFTDAFLWDEDFLGRSIGNRKEWNKLKPEWQRVDKRTPEWFIKPFEAIGKATGSNGYDRNGLTNSPAFNPSAWWYVLMQQGGGLAQVGEQAFNACAVVLGSKDADDMELKDYPLVSTVLVDAGTDNARMRLKNERFWMYKCEYEANKATISSINHARDLSPVEKAEKTSSIQDSRFNLMDFFMKTYYKPLHESIAEAEANGDKAETKRLKDRLNAVKGMLLERIEEASPPTPPQKGGEKRMNDYVGLCRNR